MLLQVPEQRAAAEAEIRAHSVVQHRNVIQLVASEIQQTRGSNSTAFLLFPYYRVCVHESVLACMVFHGANTLFRMAHYKISLSKLRGLVSHCQKTKCFS